jgi:HEAT repeat protein
MPEIEGSQKNETTDGIARATSELESTDWLVRRRAATRLVQIGAPALPALMQALSHSRSEVKEAAVRALHQIGEPAIEPLMQALQDKNPEVRTLAASALTNVRDQRVADGMRDLLYQEVAAHRKKRKKWRQRIAVVFCLWLLLFGVYVAYAINFKKGFEVPIFQFASLLQLIVAGAFVDATLTIRRNTVKALSQADDVRMIGPLVLCLNDGDEEVRKVVSKTLQVALPQLRANDRSPLSVEEREALLKTLEGEDYALIVAVLKALEQIGDERALPAVEKLLATETSEHRNLFWTRLLYGDGAAHQRRVGMAEVRKAAQECLPYLRVRAEEARQAKTLLRPTGISETVAGETLLRSAQGATSTEVEQLLRPY